MQLKCARHEWAITRTVLERRNIASLGGVIEWNVNDKKMGNDGRRARGRVIGKQGSLPVVTLAPPPTNNLIRHAHLADNTEKLPDNGVWFTSCSHYPALSRIAWRPVVVRKVMEALVCSPLYCSLSLFYIIRNRCRLLRKGCALRINRNISSFAFTSNFIICERKQSAPKLLVFW